MKISLVKPSPRRHQLRRALILLGLSFAGSSSAWAVPTGCSLTVVSPGVVFDKTFAAVSRSAMPPSVYANAPIVAKCSSSNGQAGSYRWTMTLRSLSFTMLSGTTSSAVVANVGRRFAAARYSFEVSEGVYSYMPQQQTTVNTVGQLWNLSSALSVGSYRLSQVFDVTEDYCKWTGNHFTCKWTGTVRQYRANYTLTVIDPATTPAPEPVPGSTPAPAPGTNPVPAPSPLPAPTQPEPDDDVLIPPASGAGSVVGPAAGIKPNPWTVRGYAAKRRCEICDELRFSD